MKKITKFSLLLLLSAALHTCEGKVTRITSKSHDPYKKPTAKENEKEKKRVIYSVINKVTADPLVLPQFELEWSSLPPVKNITEAQVSKAKHELEMQEEQVQELLKQRNDYLMHKYPVYAEEQKLRNAIEEYWDEHRKELMVAYNDQMNNKELYEAEEKAQPYFWKYWQLQMAYNREHPQFLPKNYTPYTQEKELSPAEIQKLARKAKMIDLAPGKSIELPTLYSGNGTLALERIIKYSLALLDGKDVSGNIATLRTKTITDKSRVGIPGATATSYKFTISSPKHAKPGTFYVLEHHVNGDISVYAMVTLGKEKAPVAPVAKKVIKAVPSKPVKVAKPVAKVKHTSGKKAADQSVAKK